MSGIHTEPGPEKPRYRVELPPPRIAPPVHPDTARLDWLEKAIDQGIIAAEFDGMRLADGVSMRAAIDARMKVNP